MAYGVGIIGAGLQGRRRASALASLPNVRLATLADTQEEAVRSLAQQVSCSYTTDWRALVERPDVDVVLVCTPPHLHAEISITAMQRGKHVLCEKPLARTVAEARAMVKTAQTRDVKLGCGFNLRYHRGIQQLRQWVDQGSLGEVILLRCRYGMGGRQGYEREWRANPEISGGGELMDQGTHVLDLARWFLGEVSQVCGLVHTAFWPIAPVEDNAFVLLKSQAGRVASLHVSWTQWKPLFSFEVFGDRGYALAEGLGGAYGSERAVRGARDFAAPFAEEVVEYRGEDPSWREDLREFLAAVAEDRDPLTGGREGLEALRLVEAVYRSSQQGSVVVLE